MPNEESRADAGTDRGMAVAKIALQLGLTFWDLRTAYVDAWWGSTLVVYLCWRDETSVNPVWW